MSCEACAALGEVATQCHWEVGICRTAQDRT